MKETIPLEERLQRQSAPDGVKALEILDQRPPYFFQGVAALTGLRSQRENLVCWQRWDEALCQKHRTSSSGPLNRQLGVWLALSGRDLLTKKSPAMLAHLLLEPMYWLEKCEGGELCHEEAPQVCQTLKPSAGAHVPPQDLQTERSSATMKHTDFSAAEHEMELDGMRKETANMKQDKNALTFGALTTMAHHRDQLDRKCQEIGRMLTGRETPLLPNGWTDEDAWSLAGSLAKLMAQVKQVKRTVFDAQHPYPSHDTPLEEIPYYNPYSLEPGEDPAVLELPIGLWTEVLYCGILTAASNPDFCFPSKGTFADLEELFLGVVRYGGGTAVNFGYVLDLLWTTLSEERLQELEDLDFGPVPPNFDDPQDTEEEVAQNYLRMAWQEWAWLCRFPCREALLRSIERVKPDELSKQAESFINQEIGLEDGLRLAIDLYLYQTGASGMLEDRYYATYAMLCRTQKQLRAADMEEA